jgi:hypothetical protein
MGQAVLEKQSAWLIAEGHQRGRNIRRDIPATNGLWDDTIQVWEMTAALRSALK